MNEVVDTGSDYSSLCSLEALYRKSQSRDSNAAISLVKCNYVCLRFETLARKAEFAKRKKVVCFCSANFWPEICKLIIFSKQFQNGIFRTGLFWGLRMWRRLGGLLMVTVYDVIMTSSNIRFSGIESCEKCEISGL